MKKGFRLVSIALLSLLVTGSALAGPFSHMREGGRDDFRTERRERPTFQEERQQAASEERHPFTFNPTAPAHGGNGEAHQGGSSTSNPPAPGPRARLSAEERQMLRHQINEAGQDIYAPKK